MEGNTIKCLKPKQYYSDLYDRHTVERCRDHIFLNAQPIKDPPLIDGKEPSEKMIEIMSKMTLDFRLMFEKGDRYIHKEETIRKWMEADKAKDDLYESATPPAGVKCLRCQEKMVLLDKDLWTGGLNEPDRVLFMFDCPNGCSPRRAFYNNGEEWKPILNPCPKCGTHLNSKDKTTEEKFVTIYTCASCAFTKTDEVKRTANKKEEPDLNFNTDRTRFCLSIEAGEKWRSQLAGLERMGKLVDSWKERDKNKEVYDKVAKIKKLTVVELEKLLLPILKKGNYINLKLSNLEIEKNVVIPFTIQDSKSGRESMASEYDLKRLFKKTLADTNWRLMSDGVSYRLGVLSGRFRGYESEEDLIKLIKL